MALAGLLVAAACSVLLVRPSQAVVLGARQDHPEALQGRDRDWGWRPTPPWANPHVPPAPVLTFRPPGPLPLSPLIPRPPPGTVTVTTRPLVSVNPPTDSPPNPSPTESTPGGVPTDTPPPPSFPGNSPPPGGTINPGSGSGPGSGTPTDILVTDKPTLSGASPTATNPTDGTGSLDGTSEGMGSNRNLVIILSTVLPAVGLLILIVALFACRRYRKGKSPFLRGISPVDDDEIATWKVPRSEKTPLPGSHTVGGGFGVGPAAGAIAGVTAGAGAAVMTGAAGGRRSSSSHRPSHSKTPSVTSVKKPPSVIVYSHPHSQGGYRHSSDNSSPRSFMSHDTGTTQAASPPYKISFEKILPQTPIQAKAPNARIGLTDESIPGDEPFIPRARRQPSRLYKMPPSVASSYRRNHVRTTSSRSSTRSFGEYAYSGSDLGLSQRHSHDNIPRTHQNGHWRVYSSSSIPPRLSFSDDSVLNGQWSPRPLLAEHEIGMAIG